MYVLTLHAQYSTLGIIQSPGSYDDGWSFGVQFTHQENWLYYGPEVYVFPDLNNMDYYHLIGRFGLQKEWGKWDTKFKLFSGGRGGLIYRESAGYTLLGLEAGLQFSYKNLYIMAAITTDNKTDSKRWGNDSYHTVNSGIIGIGIIL